MEPTRLSLWNPKTEGKKTVDRNDGSQWFAGAAGLALLAAIGIMAFATIKLLPVLWRGTVEVTRLGVPVLGTVLRHSFLGWPAEEDAQSPGTVTLLGALLWLLLGLASGLLLWIATGPNPVLLLVTTIAGAFLGAASGVAAFSQTPPEAPDPNLDDFVRW